MQQQFSEEFWRPTRVGYMASTANLKVDLENKRDCRLDQIEQTPETNCWARTHLGKVLTSDKFRLSRQEAFQKFWARSRATLHDATLGLQEIRAAGLLPTRERVYRELFELAWKQPITVKFRDGKLTFPPGTWVGEIYYELADACRLHPETVSYCLEELHQLGVIHLQKSFDGTIVQIVGYYANRPSNPHFSVRYSWPALEASLRVVPAEKPPPPCGKHTPENKKALDKFMGRRPPD